jgi:hypothetical protein
LLQDRKFPVLTFSSIEVFHLKGFSIEKKFMDEVVSGFERNQAFTTRRQLLKPSGGRSRLLEKILP